MHNLKEVASIVPETSAPSVLFLTKYPVAGASSRYRVYQYIEGLRRRGFTVEARSFFSSTGYAAVFGQAGTPRRLAATAAGIARRLGHVICASRYDLVYLQRELLPFGPPLLERWLKRRGTHLLFDYDDALFIHKPSTVSPLASRLRSADRVVELFLIADAVVAGNRYLKSQVEHAGGRAYLLEVAENLEHITQRPEHTTVGDITLGWIGSRSTEKYLERLTPVFRRFFERFPSARLVIVGGGAFSPEDLPVEHVPWSFDSEVAQLHRFDIGLMPLPVEEWSEGKCGGKARTYMAAGVPPVVQDIGYNRELIRHGETGCLVADDEDAWLETLENLALAPTRRQQMGEFARREVERRFDREQMTDQLADILQAEWQRSAGRLP